MNKNILKRIIQVMASILLMGAILFVSGNTISWINAWLLIIISLINIIINSFIFSPELIAERGKKKENVESWDKIITRIMLFPWISLYIVAGLDHRFHWTPDFSIWLTGIGLFIFIAGAAVISWAMVSNIYFSTSVRIQSDRNQSVVTVGPYRFVRHPGYIGMILNHIAVPLILNSLWALIPAAVTIVLFSVRTYFEDKTLQKKLPGYLQYTKEVKFKLIPMVW